MWIFRGVFQLCWLCSDGEVVVEYSPQPLERHSGCFIAFLTAKWLWSTLHNHLSVIFLISDQCAVLLPPILSRPALDQHQPWSQAGMLFYCRIFYLARHLISSFLISNRNAVLLPLILPRPALDQHQPWFLAGMLIYCCLFYLARHLISTSLGLRPERCSFAVNIQSSTVFPYLQISFRQHSAHRGRRATQTARPCSTNL